MRDFPAQQLLISRNIKPVMRIVIIGSGNTATILGRLLYQAGHQITEVVGRNREHTEELAKILDSAPVRITGHVNRESDIYIIAVADTAIQEVASGLHLDKKLVVHTAGSITKNVLASCTKNYGVLYPLQSLRKETDHLPLIPFLVDSNTIENRTLITDLAKSISPYVEFADDKSRLSTHVAAVMVSNFTNHLYDLAEEFCKKENISFQILLPLIKEVANRLETHLPGDVQTGPAIRNDTLTIEKHISLLQPYPLQQSAYRFLTDSIRKSHL
jgi:predicted short-subunit dehydrogenase-like oxidoreductase (DUF2520 family)